MEINSFQDFKELEILTVDEYTKNKITKPIEGDIDIVRAWRYGRECIDNFYEIDDSNYYWDIVKYGEYENIIDYYISWLSSLNKFLYENKPEGMEILIDRYLYAFEEFEGIDLLSLDGDYTHFVNQILEEVIYNIKCIQEGNSLEEVYYYLNNVIDIE